MSFKILALHRFYLAFENAVCEDYITEKFWKMKNLIVPIVLKGSYYQGNPTIPEGSYIAADQFESPKALAKYLKYLESNETEYLK